MRKIILILSLLLTVTAAEADTNSNTEMVININKLSQDHWSESEQRNVATVVDFVQKLMNEHNFDYILTHYNDSRYVQHNRNIPDKITGLVGFLEAFVEDYPDYRYDVKRITVDGNYVTFHSHATLDKADSGDDEKGLNIIDTWRLEDGKIVEHWDAIQALDGFMRFYALLAGGDIENDNGVF